MRIGSYTFLSKQWKDLEYPVDLYIKWNSRHFDEMSIYTYGKVELPDNIPSNVKIIEGVDPNDDGFNFYTFGLYKAMHSLETEWKVYLPTDEFIKERIKTENLNKRLAYPVKRIDLYGNIFTQILHAFIKYDYKIHYGNRKLLGDGTVSPPYSGSIHLDGIRYLLTDYVRRKPSYREEPIFTADYMPGTIYHTNALRSPEKMSKKWFLQFTREKYAGINRPDYDMVFNEMVSKPFNYRNYKLYWPKAELVKIDPIPILVENKERFVNVNFDLTVEERSN